MLHTLIMLKDYRSLGEARSITGTNREAELWGVWARHSGGVEKINCDASVSKN